MFCHNFWVSTNLKWSGFVTGFSKQKSQLNPQFIMASFLTKFLYLSSIYYGHLYTTILFQLCVKLASVGTGTMALQITTSDTKTAMDPGKITSEIFVSFWTNWTENIPGYGRQQMAFEQSTTDQKGMSVHTNSCFLHAKHFQKCSWNDEQFLPQIYQFVFKDWKPLKLGGRRRFQGIVNYIHTKCYLICLFVKK